MTRPSILSLLPLMCLAAGVVQPALVRAADVHVGINVGVPAPPPVVALPGPPGIVAVPGVPAVSYAPQVSFNLFAYGGQYYTYDNGNWFLAPTYGQPWAYVPREHVPRQVLAVPVRYYRVPPGHWNHEHGHPHGHHHGDEHGHGNHGHGHGQGHGHDHD